MLRAIVVVGIFAIACSHDGGGISAADYAAQDAAAICDYEVRCGLFADQASCLAFEQVRIIDYQPLLDTGKISFDGDAAQACLEAEATASCDSTQMSARELSPSCSQILVGTVGTDGACEQNAECQSGACALPDCGSACCAGTCEAGEAPAGSGEPCVTRDCDTGLACNVDTETCTPLVGSGGGCMFSQDCDYGLGCAGGECAPLPAVGDPCPNHVCADVGAICNAQGTCVMVGLPGAACGTNADCSIYMRCNGTTCEALPTVGEPCTIATSYGCSDGSFCAVPDGSNAGTCTAPGSNGASCANGDQCTSAYCATDNTCEAPPVCT